MQENRYVYSDLGSFRGVILAESVCRKIEGFLHFAPKRGPEVYFFCLRPAAFPPKGSPQMAQNLIKPEEIGYSGQNGAPEVYFFV